MVSIVTTSTQGGGHCYDNVDTGVWFLLWRHRHTWVVITITTLIRVYGLCCDDTDIGGWSVCIATLTQVSGHCYTNRWSLLWQRWCRWVVVWAFGPKQVQVLMTEGHPTLPPPGLENWSREKSDAKYLQHINKSLPVLFVCEWFVGGHCYSISSVDPGGWSLYTNVDTGGSIRLLIEFVIDCWQCALPLQTSGNLMVRGFPFPPSNTNKGRCTKAQLARKRES